MIARVAGILSVCLLLLSSLGATSALAAAAPPLTVAPAAAAITIGANSCVGPDACTLAVGPIGDNSCNGSNACYRSDGPIGDNSCNGTQVCNYSDSIGTGSCNSLALSVCTDDATVGNYSCNTDVLGACANDYTGDCALNDVTPTQCIGPDARIRRIGKHNMVGNDIYNWDGSNQTLTETLGDRAVRFVITIQNDSAVADSFTLGASTAFLIPGPPVSFYHGWPAEDISTGVWTSSYTTPTIAPGGTYRIRAVVRPFQLTVNQLAAGPGVPHYSWRVTATSVGNPVAVDAVRFTVNVPFN
jgi:hypothetical protein